MKTFLIVILCVINYSLIANTPDLSVPYKLTKQGELKLHIFLPKDHRVNDTKPVILLFFAGGWVGGEPKQFFRQCKYSLYTILLIITNEKNVL